MRSGSPTPADSVARIRSAAFPLARKGYDKREVERFLDKLASWLEAGGADEVRAELIRHDLDRAGAKADEILRDAKRRADELIVEAKRHAERIRGLPEGERPAQPPLGPLVPSDLTALDLASATVDELAGLGLSGTQARRVVAYRARLGGFASVDDLDRVPGLPGPLRESVKHRLVVRPSAAPHLAEAA